jgi:myo-inositol-1(or 4)-monophosphatase
MAIRSPTLNVMIKAAEKAARGLKRDFGEVEHLQVSKKGPGDFVSVADHKAEETIREELLKARPDFGFLGEEGGTSAKGNGADRFIVDPLDGTANFLHGLPHWAISIGHEHKGEVIAGVIYDPIKDEMFYAEKGGGAWLNSRRLRVSARKEISTAAMATGVWIKEVDTHKPWLGQIETLLSKGVNVRRWGSGALDLAYVAAGRYEGFFESLLHPWDVAAGILLVREAGGHINRLDGSKYTIGSHDILATNDALHTTILKLLKAEPAEGKTRKVAG